MRRLLVPVAVIGVLATACSLTVGSTSGSSSNPANTLGTSSPAPLPHANEPVEAVVARVLPAVVNVTTDIFQAGAGQGQGVGTGFVVRSDGIIVTNCHVVEGASKITVFSSDKNPTKYDARVIGGDCLHDMAILKIDATNLPTVALGDSASLQLGQRVVALGYALALEGGPTVTTGIVSALDRTIQATDPQCTNCQNGQRTYTGVIQTDAAINHGNSGGPLVNMQGQVVGMNTAGDANAQNIGFAIAIDAVKQTLADAEAHPLAPSAYLGVISQSVTSDLAFQFGLPVNQGAYVVATTSDGPAGSAGIQRGDVIVGIDGHTIASEADLGSVLEGLKPGTQVAVQVVGADGRNRTIQVTLGTRPLPVNLP
jgi:S1-C subfamily serine protease